MSEVYDAVRKHFRNYSGVEIAEGRGAQGLKKDKKMFAMFYKGDLTVKLKPQTVSRLIDEGKGLPHDPGTGTPLKNRLLVPSSMKESWIEMCELSFSEC